MKTKNFLLPAIAIAMLVSPVIALDFNNYREEISNIMSEVSADIKNDITSATPLLTIDELRNKINSPERITNDEFHEIVTFANLMRNNISDLEKYHLMDQCIVNKHDDILEALIVGGFDPSVDTIVAPITLPAEAVLHNDIHSFVLTFDLSDEARSIQVINELNKMDDDLDEMNKLSPETSLVNRFFNFMSQIFDTINSNPEEIE